MRGATNSRLEAAASDGLVAEQQPDEIVQEEP